MSKSSIIFSTLMIVACAVALYQEINTVLCSDSYKWYEFFNGALFPVNVWLLIQHAKKLWKSEIKDGEKG